MNVVCIAGNLCADPDMRTTQGGTPVANLRVATSERRKDGDQWVDHAEYHNVVAFGQQAEFAGRYLAKGRGVAVHGRLQTRKWQDRDGHDRYTTEIVADRIEPTTPASEGKSRREEPTGPRGGYGGRR